MLIRLVRWIGRVLLSIPWFLGWPVHVWNWAARAHHIPLKERQQSFSWCLAAFGVTLMYGFVILMGGGVLSFIEWLAAYTGIGFAAVRQGIMLSREYRHLREPRFLEYKPTN